MPVRRIIGADEVGTGCIAGPLVVCAVCVPEGWHPPVGLRDSKKLSPKQRDDLEETLRYVSGLSSTIIDFKIGLRCNQEIDKLGIRVALTNAFRGAITQLQRKYKLTAAETILDGDMRLSFATSHVKADDTFPCVSAASVLAKTYRDRLMRLYDKEYPGYEFAVNKGYPTAAHTALLRKLGPSPIHRMSFGPLQRIKHETA